MTLSEMAAAAERQQMRGLECPKCKHHEWSVYYTRQKAGKIFRRRRCLNCGRLVNTIEVVK
jgi:transcriptional regulator NrdR family protein